MTARRRRASAWLAATAVVALAWSVSLVLSPMWLAKGARDAALTPGAVVASVTYLIGSRVCHQRPERSFHLHGQSLPVCGRCTGLYFSGAAGLLAGLALRRADKRPPGTAPPVINSRIVWLAMAALPTGLTWSAEVIGLWNPGTTLRAMAAVPLGIAAGTFIAARRQ